jgi:hypothetical protein
VIEGPVTLKGPGFGIVESWPEYLVLLKRLYDGVSGWKMNGQCWISESFVCFEHFSLKTSHFTSPILEISHNLWSLLVM